MTYDPNYIPGGGAKAWLGMTFAAGMLAFLFFVFIF